MKTQQPRKPVTRQTVVDNPGSFYLGVAVNGGGRLGEGEDVNEEVELEEKPGGKGDVAHEVVDKI